MLLPVSLPSGPGVDGRMPGVAKKLFIKHAPAATTIVGNLDSEQKIWTFLMDTDGVWMPTLSLSHVPVTYVPRQVLFNGFTVGDVASWVDSLLVAYLLNFGAQSFKKIEDTAHEERQLAYTFQGINRLGLMFTQFSIAGRALQA